MKKELTNSLGKTFIAIEFNSQQRYVYNNWIGYQSFENVVAGANACIDFISQYRCSHLLNDNREVVGPWDHATEWIALDWTPRALQAGLKYFAHVVNQETLAAMSAEQMHQKVGNKFEMKVFADIVAAQTWLKECV